jgi:hypothetical protein
VGAAEAAHGLVLFEGLPSLPAIQYIASPKEVAMTRKRYAVDTVRDEPVRLRGKLDHIAAEGGRVVTVVWQPARHVALEPGLPP